MKQSFFRNRPERTAAQHYIQFLSVEFYGRHNGGLSISETNQIMTKWLIRILVSSAAFDVSKLESFENMKNYNSSEEN
jgi:hypothetical protein